MEKTNAKKSHVSGVMALNCVSTRTFGRHMHDQYGIGLLLEGAQDSWSCRGDVRAEQGQIISVNPGEVHDGRPVDERGRKWQMIYLDPAILMSYMQDLRPQSYETAEFTHPVLSNGDNAALFGQLFNAVTTQPDATNSEVVEYALLNLTALLAIDYDDLGTRHPSAAVTRAKARIDEAPEIATPLAELAEDAGLNRYSFLRAFKAATGLPPHAYRLQRQLQLARRHICSGTGLAETAAITGFADQSHFNRHFQRVFDMTPGSLVGRVSDH